MNTSKQAVINTLQSCKIIYHNLYNKVGYQLSNDEVRYMDNFEKLWETDFPEEQIFDEAGVKSEEVAFLIGYLSSER